MWTQVCKVWISDFTVGRLGGLGGLVRRTAHAWPSIPLKQPPPFLFFFLLFRRPP